MIILFGLKWGEYVNLGNSFWEGFTLHLTTLAAKLWCNFTLYSPSRKWLFLEEMFAPCVTWQPQNVKILHDSRQCAGEIVYVNFFTNSKFKYIPICKKKKKKYVSDA